MVYMNPTDHEDFEKWYREEHLDMLAKLPGYHRSLRYKIGPRTPLTQGETQSYLAIHFVEDASAFGSKEGEAASTTPVSIPLSIRTTETSETFTKAQQTISVDSETY